MKLILENFKKFEQQTLNEQDQLTNQTSFKIFDNNPKAAAAFMNNLLKGGELFKQLQAAQVKKGKPQWFQTKTVEELRKSLSEVELHYWAAYYEIKYDEEKKATLRQKQYLR